MPFISCGQQMSSITISVITPVFNRELQVVDSIRSSLKLVTSGVVKEIVVVDDASTDNSYERILNNFSNEIAGGVVKLYRLPKNQGVTGAKNFGASKASGDYLAFMDSDDVFLDGAGDKILAELERNKINKLFFFRCIDLGTQKLIGREAESNPLTIRDLINNGTPGECLPVICRKTFELYPYDPRLRGCESLSYYAMLSDCVAAMVSAHAVRGYCSAGLDRLSTKNGIRARSVYLLIYNCKTLKFYRHMTPKRLAKAFFNIARYFYMAMSSGKISLRGSLSLIPTKT